MKVSEIRQRTDDELVRLGEQLRSDMYEARVKKTTNQLDDTATVRRLRRDVARVETVQSARVIGNEKAKAE